MRKWKRPGIKKLLLVSLILMSQRGSKCSLAVISSTKWIQAVHFILSHSCLPQNLQVATLISVLQINFLPRKAFSLFPHGICLNWFCIVSIFKALSSVKSGTFNSHSHAFMNQRVFFNFDVHNWSILRCLVSKMWLRYEKKLLLYGHYKPICLKVTERYIFHPTRSIY